MKRLNKLLIDKLLFSEKPKRSRRKIEPEFDLSRIDIMSILRAEEEKAKTVLKQIEGFAKEYEKLNKKEDKKPTTEFISAPRLAMLLVASFPITAPLYVKWFGSLMLSVGLK